MRNDREFRGDCVLSVLEGGNMGIVGDVYRCIMYDVSDMVVESKEAGLDYIVGLGSNMCF